MTFQLGALCFSDQRHPQILMLFHKDIGTIGFTEVHNLIFLGLHNSMFTHVQKTINKPRLTSRISCGTYI